MIVQQWQSLPGFFSVNSSRIARGEAVFADQTEAAAFVDILRKIKCRDNLVVFAWALMSNHYHIALRAAEVPLWRSMASIQGLTTKGFNRRHRVYGPLWEGRYNSSVVEELASRRREPSLRELRELVAVLGVERYGQRVRDIAGMLEKNPGSVSRWVSAAAERRLSDSSFAERLLKLDQTLFGDG